MIPLIAAPLFPLCNGTSIFSPSPSIRPIISFLSVCCLERRCRVALEFSKENDGYDQRRKGSWRASFHPSIVHRFSFKEHYSNILSTRMSKPGRGDELLKALALLAKCGEALAGSMGVKLVRDV